jgi:hypothetical protein
VADCAGRSKTSPGGQRGDGGESGGGHRCYHYFSRRDGTGDTNLNGGQGGLPQTEPGGSRGLYPLGGPGNA